MRISSVQCTMVSVLCSEFLRKSRPTAAGPLSDKSKPGGISFWANKLSGSPTSSPSWAMRVSISDSVRQFPRFRKPVVSSINTSVVLPSALLSNCPINRSSAVRTARMMDRPSSSSFRSIRWIAGFRTSSMNSRSCGNRPSARPARRTTITAVLPRRSRENDCR